MQDGALAKETQQSNTNTYLGSYPDKPEDYKQGKWCTSQEENNTHQQGL
mgnify:CR=1 FL=1